MLLELFSLVRTIDIYLHEPFKRRIKSHLLALLEAHRILHVGRIRAKCSIMNRLNYVIFIDDIPCV